MGFMPETYMLKPYADRYQSMTLVKVVHKFERSQMQLDPSSAVSVRLRRQGMHGQ